MIELDAPEMRQSIAWEFAVMAIKRLVASDAEKSFIQGTDKRVRDIEVAVFKMASSHTCES